MIGQLAAKLKDCPLTDVVLLLDSPFCYLQLQTIKIPFCFQQSDVVDTEHFYPW